MLIIGIDPGANGGIAVWWNGEVKVAKMPPTPKDIYNYLQSCMQIAQETSNIHCYLEDVGKGIPGQSSSATAKFARHSGHLEMALIALGIPTTMVAPQKWMKALSLGSSKKFPNKTAWKNHLKDVAQREFPSINVTLWGADALLIAKYGTLNTVV